MERKDIKNYLIAYAIILMIAFSIGPYIGIVENTVLYNITCFSGEVEWFNETTEVVCGKTNPLHMIKDNPYLDLESFNLT